MKISSVSANGFEASFVEASGGLEGLRDLLFVVLEVEGEIVLEAVAFGASSVICRRVSGVRKSGNMD